MPFDGVGSFHDRRRVLDVGLDAVVTSKIFEGAIKK